MSATATTHRRPVGLRRCLPVPVSEVVAALQATPQQVIGSRLGAFWASVDGDGAGGPGWLAGAVTREVRVGFGPLVDDDDALALPIWWEDAEHPLLFPTFDGGLEVRAEGDGTELRLVGSYEPPLGPFGRFADGLAGHRVVLASLRTFLDGLAGRLVAARPVGGE